jgi:antitoxin component YwqK of YwqJK toxin-antitoxin module
VKYFENGVIESKGNYKDDKLDGEWEFYNEKGQLKEKRDLTGTD